MRAILALSLVLVAMMMTSPLLVYAQDPFTFGSTGNPFSFSGGGSPQSNSNTTLQIRSNTDWSGTYGDSTGSTTVDGHGNRDISFSCSGTYSADFQKKGEELGFLRLNVIQQENKSKSTPAALEPATSNISIEPGRSVNLTRHISDLIHPIEFQISQTGLLSDQPFNTTLLTMIKDPNGKIMIRNNTSGNQSTFSATGGLNSSSLKPDIAGNYTFTIKNTGDNVIELSADYGSYAPSVTYEITNNMTNTRTTIAQFGTVSVAGSC